MERLYYIGQAYRKVSTAGSKPMSDFESVLKKMRSKNLGLPRLYVNNGKLWWIWNKISSFIALSRMPSNKIIVFQYPFQPHIRNLIKSAHNKDNKIIILIHDLDILRGPGENYADLLFKASAIISHTKQMSSWIDNHLNIKNCIELEIFDHIGPRKFVQPAFDNRNISIVFGGNLSKANFLKDLGKISSGNIQFNIFGINPPQEIFNLPKVKYEGSVTADEFSSRISKFNFGLVWDGDSMSECSGDLGNYLRYNCPYKVSSYIAAGIPIIVWSQMGMADFVEKNGVGIKVDSLSDISDVLSCITVERYREIKLNVLNLQEKLIAGLFYENAIKKAISSITDNHE